MIGLLGGALSLAGGIAGGIKARKARREQERLISQRQQRNLDLYNRDYYQDYMNRSDAQAVMKRVTDTMRRRNNNINQTAAISGATPEAVAAQKAANNQIVTGTASALQSNADAYKARVQANYDAKEDALTNAALGQAVQTEQGYTGNMQNALNGMGRTLGESKVVGKLVDRLGSVWDK